MKIHDVTLTISDSIVTFPGDPGVEITRAHSIGKEHDSNLSKVDMGAHTGTHVDAPVHFIKGGAGAETLDLNILVGPAVVIDATKEDVISAATLEKLDIPEGVERVLFRTRNSELWKTQPHKFSEDFVGITGDGAEWLIKKGVKLVGIDYLSIAPYHHAAPTHRALLSVGAIPIEGLDLSAISPGRYFMACLPLKLKGSDGAPARVILIENFDGV